MYQVPDYARMLADKRRFDAHAAALHAAITPGAFVIEVGTGIGVFAVLAKRFGAGRVVAIETNDAIALGPLLARENGVEGIEFIHAASGDVQLDARADVVMADLRGALPIAGDGLEAMIDIRRRFLAPGGTLIPKRDTLYAAVARARSRQREATPVCEAFGVRVTLEALQPFLINAKTSRYWFAQDDLLTPRAAWATIDYRTCDTSNVLGTAEWDVTTDGLAHGIVVWFEGELLDGITVSSAPGEHSVWGMSFLPWPEPVTLSKGDRVCADIDARKVMGDHIWCWNTTFTSVSTALTRQFRQSTFHAIPLVPDKLRRAATADDGQ